MSSEKTHGSGGRYARFIPSEEVERVAQWHFGAVDERERAAVAIAEQAAAVHAEQSSPHVLGLLESVRAEGHAQGFAEGHAEAARIGQQQLDDYMAAEGRAAAQRMADIVAAVEEGVARSQDLMAQAVLDMACALARQVLRHELSDNPNALQAVVREALGMLLADGRVATVRLHPRDLDTLRQPLQEEFSSAAAVTWLADPAVSEGGCLVECAGAVIDGRLESRWARAVATLGVESGWDLPPPPVHVDVAPVPAEAGVPVEPDAADGADGSDVVLEEVHGDVDR